MTEEANATLTVDDVAKLHGTHRTTAYRWLRRKGGKHLFKRGRSWVIPAITYARLRHGGMEPVDPRVSRRFDEMEGGLAEVIRRLDKHAEALRRAGLV